MPWFVAHLYAPPAQVLVLSAFTLSQPFFLLSTPDPARFFADYADYAHYDLERRKMRI